MGRTYTVKEGDTLGHIAEKVWGRFSFWPQLFVANAPTAAAQGAD